LCGSARGRDGLRPGLRSEATGPALERALALALVIFMALAEFIYTRLLRPAPVRRAANAILLSILPETVRVGPAIVHLNPRDPVVSGALALRVFERDELRFFSQRCRPGMTVLDVGANVGLYTALAMNLTGADGTVVAIEPHAESRRFLELTVQANAATRTPVHVFDCAASDREGTAELFVNPQNKADNRLYRSEATPHAQAGRVQLRTIDGVLDGLGLHAVDILKIDVQGSEFSAITGAAKTIRNSPGMMLLSEFWPDGIRQAAGCAPERYLEVLSDLGLTLFELKGGRLTPLSFARASRLRGRRYLNLIGIGKD
jgi:FkbM family methyltransferase